MMHKKALYFVVLVLSVSLLCSTTVTPTPYELFQSPVQKSRPFIWMYWETLPGKLKPAYIDLCLETVRSNCRDDFEIRVLDKSTITDYIPDVRRDLNSIPVPVKVDYYRYCLLEKYGGIWLDADIIVMRSLKPLIKLLTYHNYVGFGCHFRDQKCKQLGNGYPWPANWVMVSRPHDVLMTRCRIACERLFSDNGLAYFSYEQNYFRIGRQLLAAEIQQLLSEKRRKWSYHHYDSTCVERDSRGNKVRNERCLANEPFDTACTSRYLFVPIYNTAPGFPRWFQEASREEILHSQHRPHMLISKLFRFAIQKNKSQLNS